MAKSESSSLTIWQKIGLLFFDKRLLTISVWLVTVIFGALSYSVFMKKEGFPSVNVPIGFVQVISFDESAEKVDENFALPIIEAAQKDENLKDITTTTSNQGSAIQMSFEDGTDVQASLDGIKSQLEGRLPQNGQVVYIKVDASKITNEGDDVLVSVHGSGLTAEQLDTSAEKLVPLLQQKVSLAKNVHVFPLIEKIVDPTTGTEKSAQLRFDRYFDEMQEASQPSVAVGVAGKDGVDQLELFDQIEAALKSEEVKGIGASTAIAVDFAENIREQVSGLQQNLLEGLIAVIIVSFILISARASVVTAISMTTTVAITIGILNLIGYSINTITLFSLVLSLALIVDDTTIMVEAIDAGLLKSKKFRDVVKLSLRKVARASAAGTFTTVLAFAPMLFIGGILGEFIRAIPITIIISLLVSLVVSFMFIPLMMRFSYGKNATESKHKKSIAHKIEDAIGGNLSRALLWSTRTLTRSLASKLHAVFFGLLVLAVGAFIFRTVEFNIFPAPKDGTEIVISTAVRNQEAADINTTQAIAENVLSDVQNIVGDDLKEITLLGQNSADRGGFTAMLHVSPIDDREKTSVEIAKELQVGLEANYPELKIGAEASGVGPPEGNFTVVIKSDDVENSRLLASDVKTYLDTLTLTRVDGTTATLKDVSLTPATAVTRDGAQRVIKVSGGFSDKDVSALVGLAEDSVRERFNEDVVAGYSLQKDALQFDFGQEEENQKSFESMGKAAGPLFLAMFILLALLFKSILQPILIFTAIPFGFIGVASGLSLTNNPLSFFSMLGVFALIGISVNNTILLTDYANQAKKEGLTPAEAMASALKARLRPLLTTSTTSVLALLPLALNDPFWEGLAYTLIFGLISSTILVILLFPYFYLIAEAIRIRVRLIFGKLLKQS